MKTLSKEQVLRLHNALLETFGGTAGVRDDGLLESALNAPFATFGGQYLYPSVQAKAAQLGFGLVCNHPFTWMATSASAPRLCWFFWQLTELNLTTRRKN